MQKTSAKQILELLLVNEFSTGLRREYRFHPVRKWRFDWAWPADCVAVEFEGGVHTSGRHVRGAGYSRDCEKYNHATAMGWKVFRFTSDMVEKGKTIDFIRNQIFSQKEG